MGADGSKDAVPPAAAPSSGSSGAAAGSGSGGIVVSLNVYSPSGQQHMVYHTGVEVDGVEYVFGGGDTSYSGVTMQRPKAPPPGSGWMFYKAVPLGSARGSREDLQRAMTDIRREFPASGYDLLSRNCNHFSDALSQRLCGQPIPSWVNRMAGIGETFRPLLGQVAAPTGGKAADLGAGGLSSAGLVAGSAAGDGDLKDLVDWSRVGVDNARGAEPGRVLEAGGAVSSDGGSTGELLVFLPLRSSVKLQELRVDAPSSAVAPSRIRLFANPPSLNVDDAAGGVAATQEFLSPAWTPSAGGTVTVTLKLNFLKFQNLGNLCLYFGRTEDQDESEQVAVRGIKLVGKV